MTTTKQAPVAARFAAVVSMIGEPQKDGINPHFRNEYVTLSGLMAHVRGPLAEMGLAVMQTLEQGGVFTNIVCTMTGDKLSVGACPLPPTADAQKMGSAITYIRRYSLMAAFGLAGEDDDGNAAVSSTTRQPAAPGNNISAAKADDAFL